MIFRFMLVPTKPVALGGFTTSAGMVSVDVMDTATEAPAESMTVRVLVPAVRNDTLMLLPLRTAPTTSGFDDTTEYEPDAPPVTFNTIDEPTWPVPLGGLTRKGAGDAEVAVTVLDALWPLASRTVMVLLPAASRDTLMTDPLTLVVATDGLDEIAVNGPLPPMAVNTRAVPTCPLSLAGLMLKGARLCVEVMEADTEAPAESITEMVLLPAALRDRLTRLPSTTAAMTPGLDDWAE